MNISFPDSYFQTALFLTFFIPAILLTLKKDTNPFVLDHSHTNELKGIAILMVLFSHVGYFLFSDKLFLYPLSVAGGVGVNIFLFLSGFGLVSSAIKSQKTILQFYVKRLRTIFIPMWVILLLTLLLDYILLHKTYSFMIIVQNFLGFFPNSDIFTAINSPLWYFTLILFYYLLFPIVYNKNHPIIGIIAFLILGYFITSFNLPVTKDVLKLYKLHYYAFPLGMAFAHMSLKNPILRIEEKLHALLLGKWKTIFVNYFFITVLSAMLGYTLIHSGVGETINKEAIVSILSVVILLLIFLLKDLQSNFLILLGKYSYEIYLIHWPLMFRHDFIYLHMPVFLGTLVYILILILFGYLLKVCIKSNH